MRHLCDTRVALVRLDKYQVSAAGIERAVTTVQHALVSISELPRDVQRQDTFEKMKMDFEQALVRLTNSIGIPSQRQR